MQKENEPSKIPSQERIPELKEKNQRTKTGVKTDLLTGSLSVEY